MRTKFLKLLLIIGVSLTVSNCTRMQSFLNTEPKGTELQKALTEEYKDIAVQEATEYDWADSQHFIEKGMKSAEGIDTMPEELERWDVPTDRMTEMRAARTSLMSVLGNKEMVDKHPKIIAKAQSSFDCWVQEQEENWQKPEIEKCRQEFYHSMKLLNPFMLEDPYTVYFAEDSYMVRAQGQQKIMDLARKIKTLEGTYEVVVNGHTDTQSDDQYNMKLAKLRAISVKKLLVRYGVAPAKISVYAFGKSDPAIPTAEEIDEPRNRRVEIYINN